ncbi:hypothetical protein C7441_104203 [Pseudaminobacter salicylatoxidans]|uniref:Uncharacterized protein n=1 Tax=Pseudaminobacter salicylatoxidans TaxID=93369 RepID=A0A316C5A3_PSESE|nr:hypothetical protein [Pseudaminobacter salicylatoxidans]PWJ84935.1 hypothetical protein C7441_104203 [Pseudaminobacter salicylatoxidans]
MPNTSPIATAPKNGSKVRVFWTDADGQENESIAQYRSADMLKALGGEGDANDVGWWAYVDSSTQKKIQPHSWAPLASDEEDE